MYAFLKERGYVIYPGKLTAQDTFRLGNIGEVNRRRRTENSADFHRLYEGIEVRR